MYYRKIVGERIYLSPVDPADAAIYTRWMNDPEVTLGLGNFDRVYTETSERTVLEDMAKDAKNLSFAIIEKAVDRVIGNCGLFALDATRRIATIGIFIGESSYMSGGYGTEALALLIDFGFRSLNLHNMNLFYFSYNARGEQAYRKLGFQEVGRRREAIRYHGKYYDEVMMDLLEEEFRQGPFADVVQLDLAGYEF